jgi:hypothetical protein
MADALCRRSCRSEPAATSDAAITAVRTRTCGQTRRRLKRCRACYRDRGSKSATIAAQRRSRLRSRSAVSRSVASMGPSGFARPYSPLAFRTWTAARSLLRPSRCNSSWSTAQPSVREIGGR